jgi:energy-coupling factor transporter ATP-binding protein EcfA2
MAQVKLSDWFNERPFWLRDAARRLLKNDSLGGQDIEELKTLCLREVEGLKGGSGYTLPDNAFDSIDAGKLKLVSIGNIQGINALAPKVPLQFGKENLAVVYGQNGAGKSGYVRILKHACGARHPGTLLPNAYSDKLVPQKCVINYEKDDVPTLQEWDASSGFLADLKNVDIFDASCGKVYMTAENEVTYEPPVLSFFSELIVICEEILSKFDAQVKKLPSKLPDLPSDYSKTSAGHWYGKLSIRTKGEDLAKYCSWTDEDEQKIVELQKRLVEKAPAEKAKQIRKKQEHIKSLIKDTVTYLDQLSDENCRRIILEKEKAILLQETAKVAAGKVFSDAPLTGVGSDVWKELWEIARKYSHDQTYPGHDFPYVDTESRCVLCHQLLSDEAKVRMISFEEFVKGTAQTEADTAKEKFEKSLGTIPDIPTINNIKIKAEAAGLVQEEDSFPLNEVYSALQGRKDLLNKVEKFEDLNTLPQCKEWIAEAEKQISESEKVAKQYDEDSVSDNSSGLRVKFFELQARKWLSQQRKPIEEELERMKAIQKLLSAKKLTNTRALSTKKGELAETLITDAFVGRFNMELENLGANHIEIELIKSKVTKGKVLHRLQLLDSNIGHPEDVLSEGEHRIVALAAFLADVTGKKQPAPFVFDDPISSLDQPFEEAVVQRLVALSQERQVIILTHRLSLLGLVQDYAKKAEVIPEVICIRKEDWGTGEPGGTPLFAKKPEKALKTLLDRLPQVRKLLDEFGQEVYDPQAKALCSDFRILVERMVECNLLADIVQRYRRAINTMGKIDNLAKINKIDCKFIDGLMTKYSRYEHAQPIEAPISMPSPDVLSTDFKALQAWHDEFKNRPTS